MFMVCHRDKVTARVYPVHLTNVGQRQADTGYTGDKTQYRFRSST